MVSSADNNHQMKAGEIIYQISWRSCPGDYCEDLIQNDDAQINVS